MDRPKLKRWFSSIVLQYGLLPYRVYSCRSLYKKAAAYRVITDKGKVFLKPFKGQTARLNQVYSRIVWLKRHNFENIPQWLKTSKGKHWVKNNGRLYYVSEWIKGTKLDGNTQDYERLGEVLAQLHLISRRSASVSRCYSLKEINRFQQQHQMFVRYLPAMRKKRQGIGKWFREYGDQCLLLAEEAWSTLLQSDLQRVLRKEEASLIHGDVTRPNVIVSSNGIYLVDWEFTRRGSAYYEVSKTLNNIANFSVEHINALLVGYEKLCPLTPEERLIIASLFRLPREAWITANKMRLGKQATIFKGLKDSWSKRMEVVQWMDMWARQQPQELVTPIDPNEEEIGIVDNQ
jgi:CotS family spore coat protein